MEKSHVRTFYLRLIVLKWIVLLFGGALLLTGLTLPTALFFDRQGVPELLGLFMIVLGILFLGVGVLCIALGLRLAFMPMSKTAQLRGHLIERRVYYKGSVYRRYFIEDTQIYWPPGSSDILRPMIGRYISLTVAMIALKPHARLQELLARFASATLKKQPSAYAVVLRYQPAINIHQSLKKYGRYYLVIYQMTYIIGAVCWAALTLYIAMQPFTLALVSQGNVLIFLLAMIGYFIASGLALYGLLKIYILLRKWLNPHYDDTPLEQKLRG